MREDIFEIELQNAIQEVYPELENIEITPSLEEQKLKSEKYGYNEVTVKAIETEEINIVPSKETQIKEGLFNKVTVEDIKAEELNITPTNEPQVFEGIYDKVSVDATKIESETLNITPSNEEQTFNGLYDNVNVSAVKGETLNVTPLKKQQTFNGLYETVNVEEIHGDTLSIVPMETTQQFNGIYENINVEKINTEEVTIDLDFSSQDTIEVTNTTGKYITKVTANKDVDLKPENIKSGININGVTGNLADTHDADATSDDILFGKTAYAGNMKIEGTFEPLDTSDATATTEDIMEGKTAYVNGVKITGTAQSGGSEFNTKIDFTNYSSGSVKPYQFITKMDFTNTDTSMLKSLSSAFSSYKELVEVIGLNAENVTTMASAFNLCSKLKKAELLNVNKCTNFQSMFASCTLLEEIGVFDFSKITMTQYIKDMFSTGCNTLSDDSLNNIMTSCISATQYPSSDPAYKSLKYMGLSQTMAERCMTLSNYQAFLDAGWVTGY